MHLGLVMECDYREGATQEEAFDEAFQMAEVAASRNLVRRIMEMIGDLRLRHATRY